MLEVEDIIKLLRKNEDFEYFDNDDKIRIARYVRQVIVELILQQTRYNKVKNDLDDLEHSINHLHILRKQED